LLNQIKDYFISLTTNKVCVKSIDLISSGNNMFQGECSTFGLKADLGAVLAWRKFYSTALPLINYAYEITC